MTPSSYTFKAINTLNKEVMIMRVADKTDADLCHIRALEEFRRRLPGLLKCQVALCDITQY